MQDPSSTGVLGGSLQIEKREIDSKRGAATGSEWRRKGPVGTW